MLFPQSTAGHRRLHWCERAGTPDTEEESAISGRTGGVGSTDKLVNPRHFEDVVLLTPFGVPDANFSRGVV